MKQRELQLRIRGLEEEEKEDVRERILNLLSELLEKRGEEIGSQTESVYILRPLKTEREGIINDIIVNFSVRKLKEEIIKSGYENPLEHNGKKIKILKELPRQVVIFRKNMRELTENLRKRNIRFRWKVPLGVTFTWKDKQITIKTEEDKIDFLKGKGKDLTE